MKRSFFFTVFVLAVILFSCTNNGDLSTATGGSNEVPPTDSAYNQPVIPPPGNTAATNSSLADTAYGLDTFAHDSLRH